MGLGKVLKKTHQKTKSDHPKTKSDCPKSKSDHPKTKSGGAIKKESKGYKIDEFDFFETIIMFSMQKCTNRDKPFKPNLPISGTFSLMATAF